METPQPPRWATRLLHLFCTDHLIEEMEGDLEELFLQRVKLLGEKKARIRYIMDVLSLIRPVVLKKTKNEYSQSTFSSTMLRNYLTIAFRNLTRNKGYSFINIAGLAAGMAVAMLIGLWIYDELSFNQNYKNYDRIARVMENRNYDGEIGTLWSASPPLGDALRSQYSSNFKHILMASNPTRVILSTESTKLIQNGYYFEPGVAEMLSLTMLYGTHKGLNEPHSVLLSESMAKAFFGDSNPVGKLMKIENTLDVKVTGVYKDLPRNSDFNDMAFIAPWSLYLSSRKWIQKDAWWQNGFQAYVQVADHVNMIDVSKKIRDIKLKHCDKEEALAKPELFLFPMSQWRLYSEFKNGVSTGGRIQFVWIYAMIGIFVLVLACINFMNLSTARSEKRAKEVGVRKAIGSLQHQLISQFFSESLLVVAFSFALCILLVQLVLPFFNDIADKNVSIAWNNSLFWLVSIAFCLFTGLLAGSYPALYLSSFQPVNVLKGTFVAGRFSAIPRKVLVVGQFTVSIALIISTIIIFQQVQFSKDRPVGYSRDGLIMIETPTPDIHKHLDAIRYELKKTTTIVELSESLNPMTGISFTSNGYEWTGKETEQQASFATVYVDHEFGQTVGWQFKAGRDFSRKFATDSMGVVLNKTAADFMGLKDPIGKTIRQTAFGQTSIYHIVGVINDMIMESPYEPVKKTIYKINNGKGNFINARINPAQSTRDALQTIEKVLKKYDPDTPFAYKFVSNEYAQKFGEEERMGKLITFFSVLAIFISCLGLSGLASYIAEQRTKEIGIRKVLGASIFNLWALLSKDFVYLVLTAFIIATPIAWYFLNGWLQSYTYRTEISWWIFAVTGLGALLITLLTVSFQSIKAALLNPVKSLRNE
ncbi:ABC transporter permease [Xanthocytophaga flava]|uniref:ABC transporter permease n=1 Tax=Xanthocytophaga flava TaxID=3048013 RepID=UPI0028D47C94|nr:ABC transporter permease [Xanthocytophaga flavus]MDJ1466594.1 permease prefix domain 2-containing transporter [Xanthocytophaga flavus]